MYQCLKIFSNRIISHTLKSTLHPKQFIRYKSKSYINNNKYVIVRVTPNDYQSVLDLFRDYYFTSEPTVIAAGLANKHNPVFENQLMQGLVQGMSLMAVCRSDGSIRGAVINTTLCPWDPNIQDDCANNCSCQKTADLMHFYAYVSRAPNLWCRFGEMKIFEITWATTRFEDQGQGIATALLQKSLELGKDLTYNVIRVDATGKYSQAMCEKNNMKCVLEIPYNSYKGRDGNILLHPPPPHTSLKIYVTLPHATDETLKHWRQS